MTSSEQTGPPSGLPEPDGAPEVTPVGTPVSADPERRARRARVLHREVLGLIEVIGRARRRQRPAVEAVGPARAASALNLVDYVAVRTLDIRELQRGLSTLGVSSLGRMEAGVLPHLLQVEATLRRIAGLEQAAPQVETLGLELESQRLGADVLEERAEQLLGPARRHRRTRIMVTFPSEAAHSPGLVREMVETGMDIARINCAHDGPREWARMIEHLRAAESATGRTVRIAMDLGGPKLRTGPIAPGPQVEKLKPLRDSLGRVLVPVRIWLGVDGSEGPAEAESVPLLDADWARARTAGEQVRTVDTRGSHRSLDVVRVSSSGVLLESEKTIYVCSGLQLRAEDGSTAVLGELPAQTQSMRVRDGDTIVLTRDMSPVPAPAAGPYRIGCSLPEVFDDAEAGQRVLIDDGRIAAEIRAAGHDELELEVVRSGPDGAKLKAEKGLNFPDTALRVTALTDRDREHLPFVAEHADMVDVSFARSARDIRDVLEALGRQAGPELDLVLKIETVGGFQALPQMLLLAMRRRGCGVMIARGDLAVEAGFERMAELQEEILWLCEAAHVPVIWATQVLESQAKSGLPSRAEITDAAAGQRAEAVMLNKGPFIEGAIQSLDSILTRMDGHVSKKADLLRRLESWALD